MLRVTTPPRLCAPVPWAPVDGLTGASPGKVSGAYACAHTGTRPTPRCHPNSTWHTGTRPQRARSPAPSTPVMCRRHGDPRALTQHTHTRSCRPSRHTHPPCVGHTEPMSPLGAWGRAPGPPGPQRRQQTQSPSPPAPRAVQLLRGRTTQGPASPLPSAPLAVPLTASRPWSQSLVCHSAAEAGRPGPARDPRHPAPTPPQAGGSAGLGR